MARELTKQELFGFLDGREYVLDGVHGRFAYEPGRPGRPWEDRLWHRPSARGRRSTAYLTIRRQLRDHWDSDLTEALERWCAIAHELGFAA